MIKLISLLIPTALALLGMVFTYKDKETGKLTGKGYLAIALIVLSGTLAFVLEIKQQTEQKKQKEMADSARVENQRFRAREEARIKYGPLFPVSIELQNTFSRRNLVAFGLGAYIDSLLLQRSETTGDDEAKYENIGEDMLMRMMESRNPQSISIRTYTLSFYADSLMHDTGVLLRFKWAKKDSAEYDLYHLSSEHAFVETLRTKDLKPFKNTNRISDYTDLEHMYVKLTVRFEDALFEQKELLGLEPGLKLLFGPNATELRIPLTYSDFDTYEERDYAYTDAMYTGCIHLPVTTD